MSFRAIEMGGGIGGRSSFVNQPASAISVGSMEISPSTHRAKNPIMSEWGKGQGCEPW